MKYDSILICLLVLATAANVGCQSTQMKLGGKELPNVFKRKNTEEESPVPVRMAVIWKDGVYEEPGKPKTRGLGGRLYFYDEDNKPVQAEGELIVYGFDDTDPKNARKPRKYVFPENELQRYFNKTDLGDSYSVWIPWDKVGGIRKAVSLIPVFKGTDGQLLKAGQTLCVLPGRAPDPTEITSRSEDDPHVKTFHNDMLKKVSQAGHQRLNNSFVQMASGVDPDQLVDQVGAQSATVSYEKRARKIRTTTIGLPKSLSEKMKALPAQSFETSDSRKANANDGEYSQRMKSYIEKLRTKSEEVGEEEGEKGVVSGVQPTIAKFPTRRPVFGKPGTLN